MTFMRTALHELISLFVEDGSLAFAILVWLVVAAAFSSHASRNYRPLTSHLFAGLALILVENALRRARNPPA